MKEIGKVSHYFGKIGVAAIELNDTLSKGDSILIKRKDGAEVKLTVESMQVDNKPVESAKKGDSIGLKVGDVVRDGDVVYRE